MSESQDQARLRQHLGELGSAAKSIGKDVVLDVRDLDNKIRRYGTLTGKEAKYALYDIEDGLAQLAKEIDSGARELPGRIASGAERAGSAISYGASRVAETTKDALETAGNKTRESGKNAAAWLAGVKRTPMKEWHHPTENERTENE